MPNVKSGDTMDRMQFLVLRMLSVMMDIAVNVCLTLSKLDTNVSLPMTRFVVRPRIATSRSFWFVGITANVHVDLEL